MQREREGERREDGGEGSRKGRKSKGEETKREANEYTVEGERNTPYYNTSHKTAPHHDPSTSSNPVKSHTPYTSNNVYGRSCLPPSPTRFRSFSLQHSTQRRRCTPALQNTRSSRTSDTAASTHPTSSSGTQSSVHLYPRIEQPRIVFPSPEVRLGRSKQHRTASPSFAVKGFPLLRRVESCIWNR